MCERVCVRVCVCVCVCVFCVSVCELCVCVCVCVCVSLQWCADVCWANGKRPIVTSRACGYSSLELQRSARLCTATAAAQDSYLTHTHTRG